MATPGSGQTDWIMGVACNEVGEINYMFMPNNNLRGNLPLEMKYLQGMEHLSLFNNQRKYQFAGVTVLRCCS